MRAQQAPATYDATRITSTAVFNRCWPEPSMTPPIGAASA
jgi:hypothetical protein